MVTSKGSCKRRNKIAFMERHTAHELHNISVLNNGQHAKVVKMTTGTIATITVTNATTLPLTAHRSSTTDCHTNTNAAHLQGGTHTPVQSTTTMAAHHKHLQGSQQWNRENHM